MANDGMGGLPEGPSNVEYGIHRMGEGPLDAVKNTDAMKGKARPLRTNDIGSLIGKPDFNSVEAGRLT